MKRRQGGFTLVEMLIALSVAALLVGLVYGAVRVGQRSADALGVQSEDTELMRIGWQFLRDAVTQARPVPDPANSGDRTGFHGMPDTIEFVADIPTYVGIGGLMRIGLHSSVTAGGQQLVLTRERFDREPATAGADPAESVVLVDDLDTLQITYFGQIEPDVPPAWHKQWSAHSALPNLVNISVTPARGRAWPVLIASPLSGASPLDETALPAEMTSPDGSEKVAE